MLYNEGFPGGSDGKASARNVGEPGLIPGLGRSPGEGNGNPLQYSCLEFHGWRSLVGYSPWAHKESDMTERLHSLLKKHVLQQSNFKSKPSDEATTPITCLWHVKCDSSALRCNVSIGNISNFNDIFYM